MPEQSQPFGVQNTNNPVLDSTVNLLMHWHAAGGPDEETIKRVYETFEELYQRGREKRSGERPAASSLRAMSKRQ